MTVFFFWPVGVGGGGPLGPPLHSRCIPICIKLTAVHTHDTVTIFVWVKLLFLKKSFWRYFGATGTLFWISGDVFSGFAEANVTYIPRDPPLVLYLPTF